MTERNKIDNDCALCKERREEIKRILKAYRRDKKIALITIGILLIELIFTLTYGKEGIMKAVELIEKFIK